MEYEIIYTVSYGIPVSVEADSPEEALQKVLNEPEDEWLQFKEGPSGDNFISAVEMWDEDGFIYATKCYEVSQHPVTRKLLADFRRKKTIEKKKAAAK